MTSYLTMIVGMFLSVALIFFPHFLLFAIASARPGNLNLDTGLLFDLRGLLTFMLIARVLIAQPGILQRALANKLFRLVLVFETYFFVSGLIVGIPMVDMLVTVFVNIGTVILIYYFSTKPNWRALLVIGYIVGCLIVVVDIFLNIIVLKTMPTHSYIAEVLLHYSDLTTQRINHNYFGFICIQGFALSLCLFYYHEKSKIGFAALIATFIFIVGAIATTSRAAMFAIVVMLGVLTATVLVKRASLVRIRAVLLMLLLIFLSFKVVLPFVMSIYKTGPLELITNRIIDEPLQMLGLKETKFVGSMALRQDLYTQAFSIFTDYPVFGVGYSALVKPQISDHYGLSGYQIHNGYLNILCELGLVGLALYLWIIGVCVVVCGKAFRTNMPAKLYAVVMLSILLFSFWQNYELISPTVFGIIGGIMWLLDSRQMKESSPESGRRSASPTAYMST